jgi:LacI family transcriptional regulator
MNVTLLEVARRANVHPSTASRALSPVLSSEVSEATRRKVLQAAAALGYRPNVNARGLRKGRTGTIGVVINDFEHPYNAAVLHGIEAVLDEVGMLAFVTESHESSERLERALDHLMGRRVDAIIVTAARASDEKAVVKAAELLPVVLAVRTLPGTRLAVVEHDDYEGGVLAARHLIGLGHRALVQLAGSDDVSSFAQRSAGFLTGLREVGLLPAQELATLPLPTIENGRALMRSVLDQARPPTAVFAHNDVMAAGALDAIAEAGLSCPGDVSVVGYDDMLLADHLAPPLTTVSLPSFHLGRLAAQMTRALLEHPDAPAARVSLPPELIVRGSTAPPTGEPAAR